MSKVLSTFLVGAVLGVAGTFLGLSLSGGEPDSVRPEGPLKRAESERAELIGANLELSARIQALEDELLAANTRTGEIRVERDLLIAKLENPEAGADPENVESTEPISRAELKSAVEKFGKALGKIIQGGGDEAVKRLRDMIARAGPEAIDWLLEEFQGDTPFLSRLIFSHAIAQSGDPRAIEALKEILLDPDTDFLELRLASHGLAFTDAEGVEPVLLRLAKEAEDTGARANSAFGLARRNHPEGAALYAKATDKAFANKDPGALQYLGGFFLLGKKGAPYVRERLERYDNIAARVMIVEVIRQTKDRESIPVLRRVLNEPDLDPALRKPVEQVLDMLESG